VKRLVLIAAVAVGALAAPAGAQPLVPSPPPQELPLTPNLPWSPPARRQEAPPLRPIPFMYRQIDRERVNTNDTVGRTNATRGTLQEELTGWAPPPLGGNVM